jgi:adenylosuccinate lyase
LILIHEAIRLTIRGLVNVIDSLSEFARRWRDLPTLGFTHFQPAQLTTVGKRACLWIADFVLDLHDLEHRLENLPFRGLKGATGTQASFLALFDGDAAKVRQLERLFAAKLGFARVCTVTGQTYSRKLDSQLLDALSGVGQSTHKFGTDLRLLAHRREIEEPFEAEQVGSSAMAYKRNPMRSERMCGLARYVCSLSANAAQTASVQWLERTLDDSVNRRLTLPQAFLATDAVLRLATNIARGLVVHPEIIRRHVAEELPFLATENLLMAAVAHGRDRQVVHACLRRHSLAAVERVKRGEANDLLERLAADPLFTGIDLAGVIEQEHFTGLAAEQTDAFLRDEIDPIRRRHTALLGDQTPIDV